MKYSIKFSFLEEKLGKSYEVVIIGNIYWYLSNDLQKFIKLSPKFSSITLLSYINVQSLDNYGMPYSKILWQYENFSEFGKSLATICQLFANISFWIRSNVRCSLSCFVERQGIAKDVDIAVLQEIQFVSNSPQSHRRQLPWQITK